MVDAFSLTGRKKSLDGLLQMKMGCSVPGAGRCNEWARAKMLSVIFGWVLPPFTSPSLRFFFQAVSLSDCMGIGREFVESPALFTLFDAADRLYTGLPP